MADATLLFHIIRPLNLYIRSFTFKEPKDTKSFFLFLKKNILFRNTTLKKSVSYFIFNRILTW